MTEEMKKDIKFLLDAVDEFQAKYNSIYVTLNHCFGECEMVASCTISKDSKIYEMMSKYNNGKYI